MTLSNMAPILELDLKLFVIDAVLLSTHSIRFDEKKDKILLCTVVPKMATFELRYSISRCMHTASAFE